MTTVSKSALVPYTAEQMYKLVDDIPAYAKFLPWCDKAREIKRTDTEVEASLDISHSGVRKSFTTRNILGKNSQIEMQLVEGPFKFLNGVWNFEPLGETGSKVSLDLEFEFSNKLLGMTFGPVFNKMASSLVDSFIQRAQKVYG
ncbi:MAG: type II toxin-antitoxin system RatA family toxin [Proteobacteria bacterium]|jgi:ribosome-associated toxin RatA of RatAB toxin-antitoxin module|nr:type II toxin-antitoxin system RatA family toxin [Pseudomonadota bacterium]MCG6934264.1 type II toxin-antitoxin system RatA family toxin [Pseudomonadota bacterium]